MRYARSVSLSIASRLSLSLVFACAAIGVLAVTSSAQTLVSAKAGLINDVTGEVSVNDGISSKPAKVGVQMEREFRLSTESDGRAELLLNPGSYLRLSSDTQMTILDNSPGQMRVGLDRGTMIVEAGSFQRNEVELEVVTPAGSIRLVKNGIYRIEASDDGRATLSVYDGEALVPTTRGELERGKKGRMAVLGPAVGQLAITKFDPRNQDGFARWSAARASTLLAANAALASAQDPSSIRLLTYSPFGDPFGYPGWGSGFWGWSSFSSCYTFFPAPGYGGFRSPYGWNYGGCGCNGWFYPWANRQWGDYYPWSFGYRAPSGTGGGGAVRGNRPPYGPGGRGDHRGARDLGPTGGGGENPLGARGGDHRGVREHPGGGGRGGGNHPSGDHSGGGGRAAPSAPSHTGPTGGGGAMPSSGGGGGRHKNNE